MFIALINKVFIILNDSAKRIEAKIEPCKLEIVRKSLLNTKIQGMTVMEVLDFGKYKTHKEVYRSNQYTIDSLADLRIEAVVPQH